MTESRANPSAVTRYSLVVPVYRNEGDLPRLLETVESLDAQLSGSMEVVFVVDGSPDRSAALLRSELEGRGLSSVVVELSRNFGAFAAIRHGLRVARGPYFAVMAADLQEPPELVLEFFRVLEGGDHDVVLGRREEREDPLLRRVPSALFWWSYRRLVQPEMPPGGVDVFAVNEAARDALLQMEATNTSLVGQLIWLGFRRHMVPYRRRAGTSTDSGWTLAKRFRYMTDSMLAFTDLPVRLLIGVGAFGGLVTVVVSVVVLTAYLRGQIHTPGYTPVILALMFATFVLLLGLGIVGSYVWRSYENSKRRPAVVEMGRRRFGGEEDG